MISRSIRPFRFTIVSYNILSQTLLNNHDVLYTECDYKDLEWPNRGHRIVNELLHNQADVICLQEVEGEHLKSLFRPSLARYGYNCLYKQKTGLKVDGCAIFYRDSLFQLMKFKGVEFNRRDITSLLNRDNVGIIAVLKPKQDLSRKSNLIVANTHLLFNPKRDEIRLAQLKLFLSELEDLSIDDESDHMCEDRFHPTILCGDFNSPPDSEIINFISNRPSPSVTMESIQVNVNATIEEDDDLNLNSLLELPFSNYQHPFKFLSVYDSHNKEGQPLVSTFSGRIVDYMFYTSRLRLESYKELITEAQLKSIGPIPNDEYPSDHVTLVARFSIV